MTLDTSNDTTSLHFTFVGKRDLNFGNGVHTELDIELMFYRSNIIEISITNDLLEARSKSKSLKSTLHTEKRQGTRCAPEFPIT